jgi:hypothetical protein
MNQTPASRPARLTKYFALGNLLAGLALILSFSPVSETIEVVTEKTPAILKQLDDRNAVFVGHMLESIRAETARAKAVAWLVSGWLLLSAFALWSLQKSRRIACEKGNEAGVGS